MSFMIATVVHNTNLRFRSKTRSKIWHSVRSAFITTIVTAMVVPLALISLYVSYRVGERTEIIDGHNVTYFCTDKTNSNPHRNGTLVKTAYIVTACFLKGTPCLLMTIFSWKLAQVLRSTSKRRDQLRAGLLGDQASSADKNLVAKLKQTQSPSQQEADQKTRMLLAIVLFYLASVSPFAIAVPTFLAVGREFQMYVFDPLFIVFDMIALCSNLTLFILLLLMSKMFRDTFNKMIWSKITVFKKQGTEKALTKESDEHSKETSEERSSPLLPVTVEEDKKKNRSELSCVIENLTIQVSSLDTPT